MTTPTKPDLYPHTRAAYSAYLEWYSSFDMRLDVITDDPKGTDEQVMALFAEKKQAWEKVQDAFYEDTKHVNGLHHCRLVGESDVMKWLAS